MSNTHYNKNISIVTQKSCNRISHFCIAIDQKTLFKIFHKQYLAGCVIFHMFFIQQLIQQHFITRFPSAHQVHKFRLNSWKFTHCGL